MEKTSRELSGASSDFLGARWFDPIEVAIRDRVAHQLLAGRPLAELPAMVAIAERSVFVARAGTW